MQKRASASNGNLKEGRTIAGLAQLLQRTQTIHVLDGETRSLSPWTRYLQWK